MVETKLGTVTDPVSVVGKGIVNNGAKPGYAELPSTPEFFVQVEEPVKDNPADDCSFVVVTYPDGYKKNHQIFDTEKDPDERIITFILQTFVNRYGADMVLASISDAGNFVFKRA